MPSQRIVNPCSICRSSCTLNAVKCSERHCGEWTHWSCLNSSSEEFEQRAGELNLLLYFVCNRCAFDKNLINFNYKASLIRYASYLFYLDYLVDFISFFWL